MASRKLASNAIRKWPSAIRHGADHDGLGAPQQAVGHQAAEQRRQVDQAGVEAGDQRAQLQRRARPGDGLDGGAHHVDAHHVADVLGQEQILGQVQAQQHLHAVVGEALPQLAGREPAEAERVAQERGVVARERLVGSGSGRGHDALFSETGCGTVVQPGRRRKAESPEPATNGEIGGAKGGRPAADEGQRLTSRISNTLGQNLPVTHSRFVAGS